MKKPKLPARKTIVNQLDQAFATYIKMRDRERGCPWHTTFTPVEHCFHFITRARHSTRWDAANAVGSCAGCNLRYEHDTLFIAQVFRWYVDQHGEEAWDALRGRAAMISQFSRTDLIDMRDDFRRMLGN